MLAALVAMLGSGQVPPAIAGLAAAVAMVLARVVPVAQAYRAVSWQTVVLVGALIPLSTAIRTSGAADQVASLLIDAVGDSQPYLLMVALFLLTATLGQVVSNTATVLVVTPIAVAAADGHRHVGHDAADGGRHRRRGRPADPDRDPRQPDDHEPGGYRFGDYWKLGLPILGWWFVVALTVVPLVWAP